MTQPRKDFSLVVLKGRLIFMDGVKILLGFSFRVGSDYSLLTLTRLDVPAVGTVN